jgi:GAF domain-containing protein
MTRRNASDAFADAASALVNATETADVLFALVDDCATMTGAGAVALILHTDADGLELATATSHRARDLEIMQMQMGGGPCLDAVHTHQPVIATTPQAINERWGEVGTRIVAAGYQAVHAYPLIWRGQSLGGLNVFHERSGPLTGEAARLAQAFVDMCTAAIIQGQASQEQTRLGRTRALNARSVIEQAKGVLAEQAGLSMTEAYDQLLARAHRDGTSLTDTARTILASAHRPRPDA